MPTAQQLALRFAEVFIPIANDVSEIRGAVEETAADGGLFINIDLAIQGAMGSLRLADA